MKIERIVAALHVGIAIHPDIVTAQIEGTGRNRSVGCQAKHPCRDRNYRGSRYDVVSVMSISEA